MFVILENICFIPRSGILDTQEYLRVFLFVEKMHFLWPEPQRTDLVFVPQYFEVPRALIKISSCRANDTSRRGTQQLRILLDSIFLLFSYKSREGGVTFIIAGGNPQPPALSVPLRWAVELNQSKWKQLFWKVLSVLLNRELEQLLGRRQQKLPPYCTL